MELGLGEFIAAIEKYFGVKAAKYATLFVASVGGLVLLGLAFQFAVVPARDGILVPAAEWAQVNARWLRTLQALFTVVASAAVSLIAYLVGARFIQGVWRRSADKLLRDIKVTNAASAAMVSAMESILSATWGTGERDEQADWLLSGALPDEARITSDQELDTFRFKLEWARDLTRTTLSEHRETRLERLVMWSVK